MSPPRVLVGVGLSAALAALGLGGALGPPRLLPVRALEGSGRAAPLGHVRASTVAGELAEAPGGADAGTRVAGLAGAPLAADGPEDSALEPGLAAEPAEPEAPAAAPADPETLDPSALLGALSKETPVRARPDPKAPLLGLLRMGALVRRARAPSGTRGCAGGWYRVEPSGYVCVGKAATLELEHPLLQLTSQPPDRSLPLPYVYGRSRYPTPPLYTRIPSASEQATVEQDLRGHLKKGFGALWAEQADTPPHSLLASGERVPRPFGYPMLERPYVSGRALGNSAFAFVDLFEADGRRYGLTADLNVVPLDRVTPVEGSDFFGKVLGEGEGLPLVFVRGEGELLYSGDPEAGTLRPERAIESREAFSLGARRVRYGGLVLLETRSGQWLREQPRLVRVEPRSALPRWAKGSKSWLDVSILRQTLVAYEGERPVFATLVSTGRDGLGDPKTTHSTVQGVFVVHTKHVTATMSGSEADDEFDLRDVPYVQYFEGGYALHAAYWHDGFGQPRSHGCINLSPADARYLFNWTAPPVPARWHSALSREGSLVYIHP